MKRRHVWRLPGGRVLSARMGDDCLSPDPFDALDGLAGRRKQRVWVRREACNSCRRVVGGLQMSDASYPFGGTGDLVFGTSSDVLLVSVA